MKIKSDDKINVLNDIKSFLISFFTEFNKDLKNDTIGFKYFNKNNNIIVNIYNKFRKCLITIYIHRRLMLIINDERIVEQRKNLNINELKEFFKNFFKNVYMIYLIESIEYKFIRERYYYDKFEINKYLTSNINNNSLDYYFKLLPISVQQENNYILQAKNFDLL